jgi:phage protein U
MANTTLYQFGFVQWQVYPFNIHELSHTTSTDWSRKEIAGAPIFREWVGEGDEEITMRGRVFPNFFANRGNGKASDSGLGHLDILDEHRRFGRANMLIRGDSLILGWFVIERLSRGHSFLNAQGIGQQIEFEATFARVPVPDGTTFYRDNTFFGNG